MTAPWAAPTLAPMFDGVRAWLAVLSVCGLSFAAGACGDRDRPPARTTAATPAPARPGRLLILGFDGVDPRWLERWAGEGKLPNLKRLMDADGRRR